MGDAVSTRMCAACERRIPEDQLLELSLSEWACRDKEECNTAFEELMERLSYVEGGGR